MAIPLLLLPTGGGVSGGEGGGVGGVGLPSLVHHLPWHPSSQLDWPTLHQLPP